MTYQEVVQYCYNNASFKLSIFSYYRNNRCQKIGTQPCILGSTEASASFRQEFCKVKNIKSISLKQEKNATKEVLTLNLLSFS